MNRVIVMGGSFNPPTIAHLKIMQYALDAVNADTGYFVPVSTPYLKRKMMKAGQSHLCLSDELRLRMIKAMIEDDNRLHIDTGEMNEVFAVTKRTMYMTQERHPGARIYFVAGADKIPLLETFVQKWDFLNDYSVIVLSRQGYDLMDEIAHHELLSNWQSSIVTLTLPDETDGVSSTRIRENLFNIDAAANMLHPAVAAILKEIKTEDYPEEIIRFKDDYAFLANAYPVPVEYEGIVYPCAASAFLASKCSDRSERLRISQMNIDKAKQRFGSASVTREWEQNQIVIMEDIVRSKFYNKELQSMLLATGDRRLINGSKKDTFWGIDLITWKGENQLGNILMRIREEKG